MTGLIELKLNDLNQLFNSMDPSPFHERDLDRNAEEFIVSWAREHPRQQELKLVIHLANAPAAGIDPRQQVADSVAHYFEYQAEQTLREFKRLMREGRMALVVGILFLSICQVTANLVFIAPGLIAEQVKGNIRSIQSVSHCKPMTRTRTNHDR